MRVPIEVSARHVHLNQKACEALFGKDYELRVKKLLSQPGEFAAKETVAIETEKDRIDGVRILGPLRDYNQVEISKSDAYRLGLNPPVRDSHELNHDGTPGIKVIGPEGSIALTKGVIIAWRHIHMNHNEALELGVEDGQIVKVDIDDNPRTVVFENVVVRVAADNKLAMHIDTDEANASGIVGRGIGKLISSPPPSSRASQGNTSEVIPSERSESRGSSDGGGIGKRRIPSGEYQIPKPK